MKAKDLLAFIPDQDLSQLAARTRVDHQVKKLSGRVMFQLLLLSLLEGGKASLRVMEELYCSMQFRTLADVGQGQTTRYNSIRDRIVTMRPDFFRAIFELLFARFNRLLGEQRALVRYDSTLIAVSARLVAWSMRTRSGSKQSCQLKCTLAMKGSLPCQVRVFTNRQALSEDCALPETILSSEISRSGIVVFERGVQSRKALKELDERGRLFVTRCKVGSHCLEQERLAVGQQPEGTTLTVLSDAWVSFREKPGSYLEKPLRLVKATLESGEPICFVTNIAWLDAYQVAAIYRERWQIEVLIKFLKQHLQLEHLLTRDVNGIQVMRYMTLIVALLLIVYRKLNKLDSDRRARLRFAQELDVEIVRQIVLLCGGDPAKMEKFVT
ncbi:IS4 family transposase [Pontibacter sp. HSC-14F20]|uniref:IS4 family transposase n=1 Tax=Pontibacter sp. HSC-14F20 TaxID=2864136 RepID=UPI001C73428D|nr:IS4 family transposase [Pontibacter sp. HSC-14F20]MBX0333330.1 IS4 family transposase [Pontibacter sp. HSC-14F20]